MPSNVHTLADLRAKASSSATTTTAPPATAPKGRTITASTMSGASGLVLSGGTFTNVGDTAYRRRPAGIAATSPPKATLKESGNETVIAEMLGNVRNLTATDGVEVDNFGIELLAGQRPKKGQNIHVRLLDKVKDSEFKGGKFTNAATVVYVDKVDAKEKV